MKLYRSALTAGILALGVAACGDDVQVVDPPPPPPPALQVSMNPGSATVAVGNSADYAINVSGGAAGEAASWTCATSNSGIASVASTASGCRATGVAIGGATITATVTKGDESTSVGAEITVTDDASAVVTINSINQGGVPAVSPFAGQLDVVINVERGDQVLDQLDLLVDGEVVASQTFATTAAPADDAEEQAIQTVTLSFNTAFYTVDAVAGTAAIRHLNGDHGVAAQLSVAGASTPIASNTVPVTFLNPHGIHIIASLPTKVDGTSASALSAASGLIWYGGPADVTGTVITGIPVIYTAVTAIQSVSMTMCGALTDTTAPFQFTYDGAAAICGGFEGAGMGPGGISAIADGATVLGPVLPILNTDHPFPINIDYLGQGAPTFVANPNGRQNGWINGAVGLVGTNTSATDNDWLAPGAADGGVGGYNPMLRVDTSAPATVDAANAATPEAAPALPAPTVNNDDICFVASATDDLGNESTLPAAGAACLSPPFALLATASSSLRGGVDIIQPTIAFTGASLAANARIATPTVAAEYQVTVSDLGAVGNSGMLSGSPVTARLETRSSATTVCGPAAALPGSLVTGVCTSNANGLLAALPLVTTTGVAALTTPAYYTIAATSHDAAGNSSDEVSRVVVRDNAIVIATPPAVPVVITGAFLASAFLNDDLSIRDYYWTATFGGGLTAGATARLAAAVTAVDAYNAAALTNTNFAINTTVNTFLGLQTPAPAAYAAGAAPLAAVNLFARDQTQAAYTAGAPAAVAPTAPAAGVAVVNALPAWAFATYVDATADPVICATLIAGACAAPGQTTTTWTAVATGTTATFPNPFSRVDFYAVDAAGVDMRLIGSVPAGAATLVDDGATRVWTYSLGVSGAAVYAALEGVSPAVINLAAVVNVQAFGVSAAGDVAMVGLGFAQTIDPGT